MLTIVIGREAGNQTIDGMHAVGWSIKNRVTLQAKRWGQEYTDVIEKPWQYSSIEGPQSDPNLKKYPDLDVKPWPDAFQAAVDVYFERVPDPTGGAHSYFDKSLDANPPAWANDGEYVHTVDVGAFHFFRLAKT